MSDHREQIQQFKTRVDVHIESARRRPGRCRRPECPVCREVERHLDVIQSEIELLLRRTDQTPAHIRLTAH